MREKIWKVKNKITAEDFEDLGEEKFLEKVEETLLAYRGLEGAEKNEFLSPQHPVELPLEAFGLTDEVLENAASVIFSAIEEESPIIIHGDFDADGVCATAILWQAIYRGLGYEKCLPFIPNRFKHGYGVSKESIGMIFEMVDAKWQMENVLLITVDCGITAGAEIQRAKELGWDVLVTDHHQKEEGKDSLKGIEGVVWTDKICGAGIAWLIAKRLANFKIQNSKFKIATEGSLDLVALATVADVEPLLGPNRSFVKYGLEVLNESPSVGLRALMKIAGVEPGDVGTYELGWVIAPRINAAGRLASATDALRLLCTHDPIQAGELASKLDKLNRKRQEKTNSMVELAYCNAEKMCEEHKVLIVSNEEFHEGIIGLIAGKLTREFYLPTVAISEGSQFSKGSARSVSGFNIVEALRELEDLLEGVGGHPMAAGFTIRTERIEEFRAVLLKRAKERLSETELKPSLEVDLKLPFPGISWQLWDVVNMFEPFGTANPRPLFCSRAGIVDVSTVGRTNRHLKLKLQSISGNQFPNQRGSVRSAVGFGMGELASSLSLGDKVEIVYSLLENKWNGNCKLELKLKDIRKAEE